VSRRKIKERQFAPVLGALYYTDNGRVLCGRHLGVSAATTGRDISGQSVAEVTADDSAQARYDGWEVKCETCGAQYGAAAVPPRSVDLLNPVAREQRVRARLSPQDRYDLFVSERGRRGPRPIPDRGFAVARRGGDYEAFFDRKPDARMAAKLLAGAFGCRADLVQIQARGEERFVVGEFAPKSWDRP